MRKTTSVRSSYAKTVLILVLMEDDLWEKFYLTLLFACAVLILVLMEDDLWGGKTMSDWEQIFRVLILVLMEDNLWELSRME